MNTPFERQTRLKKINDRLACMFFSCSHGDVESLEANLLYLISEMGMTIKEIQGVKKNGDSLIFYIFNSEILTDLVWEGYDGDYCSKNLKREKIRPFSVKSSHPTLYKDGYPINMIEIYRDTDTELTEKHITCLKLLLKYGFDHMEYNKYGQLLIHCLNKPEIMQIFLHLGVNIDHPTQVYEDKENVSSTALRNAILWQDDDSQRYAKFLIDNGADVNYGDLYLEFRRMANMFVGSINFTLLKENNEMDEEKFEFFKYLVSKGMSLKNFNFHKIFYCIVNDTICSCKKCHGSEESRIQRKEIVEKQKILVNKYLDLLEEHGAYLFPPDEILNRDEVLHRFRFSPDYSLDFSLDFSRDIVFDRYIQKTTLPCEYAQKILNLFDYYIPSKRYSKKNWGHMNVVDKLQKKILSESGISILSQNKIMNYVYSSWFDPYIDVIITNLTNPSFNNVNNMRQRWIKMIFDLTPKREFIKSSIEKLIRYVDMNLDSITWSHSMDIYPDSKIMDYVTVSLAEKILIKSIQSENFFIKAIAIYTKAHKHQDIETIEKGIRDQITNYKLQCDQSNRSKRRRVHRYCESLYKCLKEYRPINAREVH